MPDAKKPHAALSYDKWSHIEGASSDEEEALDAGRPLLASNKGHAQHQADEQLYETFKARFKQHFKGRAPLKQRKLLSRFIAVQHSGPEASNTYRYADIIGIVTQRHDELMDASCVALLCGLHKELLKQADPGQGGATDAAAQEHAQVVMQAINTLEAVQRHPPVTALFEQLCSPSSSPEARKLCERYTQLAFAKVALMRSVFGDDQTTREAERQFLGELSQAGGSAGGSSRFETAAVTAVFLLLVLGLVKALVYMADILSAA